MKKIILVFLLTTIILFPKTMFGQQATPTPQAGTGVPTSDSELEQVQRIRDIVASKVAELNLVEKRGIIATVTDTSNTKITVVGSDDKSIDIDVDELTKFDFDDDAFGVLDLEINETYSFVGLYNKDSDRLLARFISKPNSIPLFIEGAISEISEAEFQIEVIGASGNTTAIDIERSTSTMLVGEDGTLERSGFSGLEVGQRIIVVGFETDDSILSATRLIHFTDIPPSADVRAKLSGESSTATGSGNTLEILEVEED